MIFLKSKDELDVMRSAGAIAAEALFLIEENLKAGMTTDDLDQIAENFIRSKNAIPTFIGYQGYPKTLCTSINEEVVHGIPNKKKIKDGDLIGIDIGVTYKGFVGDHAKSFCVGAVPPEREKLAKVTEQALYAGIDAFKLGNRVGDISYAVQQVAEDHGYGIVKDFVGHGVGRRMHEEPQVPNFGEPKTGPRLKVGMVLAIEPMFNLGTGEVEILKDGWTVVTKDRKDSAHFEHTIALTDTGCEILTKI